MSWSFLHLSVENNSGGTLENNSSVENNSGGTLENNSDGTLENERLVLYVPNCRRAAGEPQLGD